MREKIQENTEKIEVNPISGFSFSPEIAGLKSYLRSLFFSVLLHAVSIGGCYAATHDFALSRLDRKVQINGGVFEKIKSAADDLIEDKELEEKYPGLDSKKKQLYKKFRDAVRKRKARREKNIDEDKVSDFKRKWGSKLEKGEDISFIEFLFEFDEVVAGVDTTTVDKARRIFEEDMQFLLKKKPVKPTSEFLRLIGSHTEEPDVKGSYEPTQTTVSVYLARKGLGKRGNCEARQKYQTMALLYLYPELSADIKIQLTRTHLNMNHLRALVRVDGDYYKIEDGEKLSEFERCGTIIFSPRQVVENAVGYKKSPLALECGTKPKQKDDLNQPSPNVPVPPTDNEIDYPVPDQPLEPKNILKSDLLEEENLPPEVDEDSKKQYRVVHEWPNSQELMLLEDVSEERLRMELLKQKIPDFRDIITSPTVDTVRRINRIVRLHQEPRVDVPVNYRDIEFFSAEALEEIFKIQFPAIQLSTYSAVVPENLTRVAEKGTTLRSYPGRLYISFFFSKEPPYDTLVKLSSNDWKILLEGKGEIHFLFSRTGYIGAEGIESIASSSRPAVIISGNICLDDIDNFERIRYSEAKLGLASGYEIFEIAYYLPSILSYENVLTPLELGDREMFLSVEDLELFFFNGTLLLLKLQYERNKPEYINKVRKLLDLGRTNALYNEEYIKAMSEVIARAEAAFRKGGTSVKPKKFMYCNKMK
jgi:hypothetical protein